MKNFVQCGKTISVTAPASGLVSGAPALIGVALFGVAAYSAAAGASGEIVTSGVFDLPKGSTAFAVGAQGLLGRDQQGHHGDGYR